MRVLGEAMVVGGATPQLLNLAKCNLYLIAQLREQSLGLDEQAQIELHAHCLLTGGA